MPPAPDQALRLVIVDDGVEAAEAIVSTLRNAGIAVRPQRPATCEELKDLIDAQAVDLVLAARLPGYLLPRLVREVAGAASKLPL